MKKSSRIKIYIAEDESIILMNFKMILQQLGYEVVGSSVNGEKALKDILELKPDLLLLDINATAGWYLFVRISIEGI